MTRRIIGIAVVLAILSVVPLSQAATISILDYSVAPGTSSFDVPVQISGSEFVTDMAGAIFVGEGGTLAGKPQAPGVTAVSYAGSIWQGAATGYDTSLGNAGTNEIVFADLNLKETSEAVSANGTLLTFTLDLTGFSAGESFDLSMGIAALQETTLRDDQGTTFTPSFEDGSITIIPEPSTLLMVFLGGLGFLMVRRLRRAA